MIVRMKKKSEGMNVLMVENVIRFFQKKGFDVQVRDKHGDVLIAIIGPMAEEVSHLEIKRLAGIKSIEANDLFIALHTEFEEAWRYLRSIDGHEKESAYSQQA